MNYNGKFAIFNNQMITTYPLAGRDNKVKQDDIISLRSASERSIHLPNQIQDDLKSIVDAITTCRQANRPVILFTGAHLIKNGLGLLLRDLIQKDLITLVAGNGATGIHDFELALQGQTSENVPNGLEDGTFGMAYEFAYINAALAVGNRYELGYGESLGRMITDPDFQAEATKFLDKPGRPVKFEYPQFSVLEACYNRRIPFTIHAGIGTDVIDQHPSFDGQAKGGCSGRDFLIYVQEVKKMHEGGVALNIGSAVTGPEVLLKSVSMAANINRPPRGIVTADFDLRSYAAEEMNDQQKEHYYFRDQKSVVTRIPNAYKGRGYYLQGNIRETFVRLYQILTNNKL